MGSTGTTREKGVTDREFFENEFPTTLRQYGRILDCASMPGYGEWNRVFFAAVQNTDDAPYKPGKVWCLVVCMHTVRNPNAWPNFYYKEMSDESGPAADNCPRRILDLLSETDAAFSIEWRARCRVVNNKKDKAKLVKDGTVVQFEQPFQFANDQEVGRFRFRKDGRRRYWIALTEEGDYRFTCRLPQNWYERTWSLA